MTYKKLYYIDDDGDGFEVEITCEIENESAQYFEYGDAVIRTTPVLYIEDMRYEPSEFTDEQIKLIDEYMTLNDKSMSKDFFKLLEQDQDEWAEERAMSKAFNF